LLLYQILQKGQQVFQKKIKPHFGDFSVQISSGTIVVDGNTERTPVDTSDSLDSDDTATLVGVGVGLHCGTSIE